MSEKHILKGSKTYSFLLDLNRLLQRQVSEKVFIEDFKETSIGKGQKSILVLKINYKASEIDKEIILYLPYLTLVFLFGDSFNSIEKNTEGCIKALKAGQNKKEEEFLYIFSWYILFSAAMPDEVFNLVEEEENGNLGFSLEEAFYLNDISDIVKDKSVYCFDIAAGEKTFANFYFSLEDGLNSDSILKEDLGKDINIKDLANTIKDETLEEYKIYSYLRTKHENLDLLKIFPEDCLRVISIDLEFLETMTLGEYVLSTPRDTFISVLNLRDSKMLIQLEPLIVGLSSGLELENINLSDDQISDIKQLLEKRVFAQLTEIWDFSESDISTLEAKDNTDLLEEEEFSRFFSLSDIVYTVFYKLSYNKKDYFISFVYKEDFIKERLSF